MKVYAVFADARMALGQVPAYARRVEALGYDGLLVPEAIHDGMMAAMLAAEHSERIEIITSVVLAFPRSPMTLAYAARDVHELSGGRFSLGLGSQVRGNMVGRFSVQWHPPAARMRDYVGSLRAIWQSWQNGQQLSFESEHYRFSRMQPFFNPGPSEHGRIPVYLGAVGPKMAEVAGQVADGLLTHPTNSDPRYVREVSVAAITKGRPRSFNLIASTFVATGPDVEAVATERERIRDYLGFLYSTPNYWPTLKLHGWEEVGRRLNEHAKKGRWEVMKAEISDEMLDVLVPSATYQDIASLLMKWYGGLAAGITLPVPADPADDEALASVVCQLKQG
ncbi:MAG: TIGR03617 family F420-dependent LLM class oxidoreductase [Deltaproteobacteria bacterium]